MSVQTINYETPQFLQGLIANDHQWFRRLGEAFEVKVTSRDAWVRLEGEERGISMTKEVLGQLEKVMRHGGEVNGALFNLVVETVRDTQGTEPSGRIMSLKLLGSSRRPPVLAKTRGQVEYLEAMRAHEVVFGVGPAGTGKTYLAMAQGLQCLRDKTVQRLVLTRPAVEAGEALGFLPGDLKEKIMPYLRPLYDALYDMLDAEEMQRLMERGVIEIAPLAYMRGRTLNHAFVVLDEAQNTTTEQMFMFLTRLGTDSKAVITGDHTQIDLPANKRSGLIEAMQALQNVEAISFCHFDERDVVRHELVQSIVRAYRHHRGTGEPETKR